MHIKCIQIWKKYVFVFLDSIYYLKGNLMIIIIHNNNNNNNNYS